MTRQRIPVCLAVICLLSGGTLRSQAGPTSGAAEANTAASASVVPRLIKFGGQIDPQIAQITQNEAEKNRRSALEVTFSLYELQDGGSPLWSELQKVQLDGQGRYTVLLGATQAEGLPLDLFTSGKALWLGVQPQLSGAVEQPRVLLVAVPYALKASDSDTLGGRPASAYALAGSPTLVAAASGASSSAVASTAAPTGNQSANGTATTPQPASACSAVTSDGTATANAMAKFTSACNIQKSLIFDNGTSIGVGTNNPAAFLDAQNTITATASGFNYGLRALTTANPAAASSASVFSLFASAQTQSGNTQNFYNLYGMDFRTDHFGTGTVNGAYGGFGAVLNHAAGTISSAFGLYTYLSNGGTGTITNSYGLYLAPPLNTGGGLFSHYVGVYIANPTAVVPNAYGVYSAGGINYFAGDVGIGTTAPAARLEVNGASQFDLGVTFKAPVVFAAAQTFPIPNHGVTNAMLQNSSLTITTGAGLSGGGTVALGSSLNLSNTGVLGVGTTAGSGILLGGTPANPSLSADTSVLATNTSVSSAVAGGVTTAENFATSAVNMASTAITGSALTLNTTSPITGGPVTFHPGTNASLTLGVDASALETTLNSTYAQLGAANMFTMPQTLSGGGVLPATGTATTGTPASSNPLDFFASSWNGSNPVNERFRWQAEGNGSVDAGSLNLLSASGANPTLAETGLSIASNGAITFAPAQTFPSGVGTVTSVGSGAGLSGGPITSSGTLSIASAGVTDAMLASSYSGTGACTVGQVVTGLNRNGAPTCVTASTGTITGVTAGKDLTGGGLSGPVTLNLDTSKVPELGAANVFTLGQTIDGPTTITGNQGSTTLSVSNGSGWGIQGFAPQQYFSIGVLGSLTSSSGFSHSFSLLNGDDGLDAGVWADGPNGQTASLIVTADNLYGGIFFNDSATYPTISLNNNAGGPTGAAVPGIATVLRAEGPGGVCGINQTGGLACTGQLKAVVATQNGAHQVETYAVQSAENWLEDYGSGQLVNGSVTVHLDPAFADTVNTGVDFHVFLTPGGDCKGLYVTNKTATGFEVHELGGGVASIPFDYKIVAKRRGHENERLVDVTARMKLETEAAHPRPLPSPRPPGRTMVPGSRTASPAMTVKAPA